MDLQTLILSPNLRVLRIVVNTGNWQDNPVSLTFSAQHLSLNEMQALLLQRALSSEPICKQAQWYFGFTQVA